MSVSTPILAMATPPGGGQASSPWMNFVPLVLVFVIFYFLLIAPQRKKQKQHAKMLADLKNGDRVVTSGGLHGTVVGVTDSTVHLRIADQVKVEVARHAIAELRPEGS